jgi:hypothetical protein
LERELRLDLEHVEVINAAHYGYGTDQELLFFQDIGNRWQPDVVLLAFTPGNDIENNLSPISIAPKPYFTRSGAGGLELHPLPSRSSGASGTGPPNAIDANASRGWFSAVKSSLYNHSKFYRFVTFQVRIRFPGARNLLRRLGVVGPNVVHSVPEVGASDADRHREGLALTAAILRQLREDVSAKGGELVVLIMPDPSQAGAAPMGSGNPDVDGWPASRSGADRHRISRIARDISQSCVEAGISVIDLFTAFELLGSPIALQPLFYRLDGHLTSEGHAVSARVIREALEQRRPRIIAR